MRIAIPMSASAHQYLAINLLGGSVGAVETMEAVREKSGSTPAEQAVSLPTFLPDSHRYRKGGIAVEAAVHASGSPSVCKREVSEVEMP